MQEHSHVVVRGVVGADAVLVARRDLFVDEHDAEEHLHGEQHQDVLLHQLQKRHRVTASSVALASN